MEPKLKEMILEQISKLLDKENATVTFNNKIEPLFDWVGPVGLELLGQSLIVSQDEHQIIIETRSSDIVSWEREEPY